MSLTVRMSHLANGIIRPHLTIATAQILGVKNNTSNALKARESATNSADALTAQITYLQKVLSLNLKGKLSYLLLCHFPHEHFDC